MATYLCMHRMHIPAMVKESGQGRSQGGARGLEPPPPEPGKNKKISEIKQNTKIKIKFKN